MGEYDQEDIVVFVHERALAAAASGKATALEAKNQHYYPRTDFDGRFDGLVDEDRRTITVIMRTYVHLEGPGWDGDKFASQTLDTFRQKMKSIAQSTWSQYYLKPAWPMRKSGPFRLVFVCYMVGAKEGAHLVVHLLKDVSGGRSGVYIARDAGGRVEGVFQESDCSKTAMQIPVAHEIGHAMGLNHIACAKKKGWKDMCNCGELACYGNATEKDNIMGQGMTVAFANLEPFLRIAKRFGKDVIPKQYQDKGNVWTPVVSFDG